MAVIAAWILFTKPLIGMADNGDFFREIHNIGLYYLTDNFDDRHFGYFNTYYGIRQYPYDHNTLFVSSLSLLIRLALTIDLWLTSDSIFDIRFLGALYTAAFVAAFYMLVKRATAGKALPVATAVAVMAVVIFGDVGYLAYFNSFYGEPASYVSLLLTLAFAFRLLQRERPSMAEFIAFAVSACVFAAAKQQNAPVGILLALLCIRFMYLRKDKPWRTLAISAATAITLLSAIVYVSITDDIKHINQYHAVTRGILENSANPQRDVEELGLDAKFSILAGTTYYDQYVLEKNESPLMQEQFYGKFGYGAILKYYVLHADRAVEKLDMAARNAFSIRPEVLGNYEKSEHLGYGRKTSAFSLWSELKLNIFPKSFRFLLLFYALYYGGILRYYLGKWRKGDKRGMMRLELMALVGLIGVAQLGVSFLGAGDADMAKHLFLFNVTFDWMFAAMAAHGLHLVYTKLATGKRAGSYLWRQKSSISG